MSLHIYIDTIPHSEQRYPTVGDYWYPEVKGISTPRMEVRISSLNNEDYELLVAIHELVEAHLCRKAGISEEAITAFDKTFEANRPEGNTDEPGNDPTAPYHKEHIFATDIERHLAAILGIDWETYDAAVNAL